MNKPWICCGTKELSHPITENHGSSCTLPSCPNKAPLTHRVMPWTPGIAAISGLVLMAGIAKAIVPTPSPILFVHILDRSASAIDDSVFPQGVSQTCTAIANTSKQNFDSTFQVLVDSIADAPYDQKQIQSKGEFRQNCQESFKLRNDAKLNTYVCDAWNMAISELNNSSNNEKPIVITQIHSNENETFCSNTLKTLSSTITEGNGFHIIVGSTNEGFVNQGLNTNFRDFMNKSENAEFKYRTRFIDSSNPGTCIKKITNSIRYKEDFNDTDTRC